MTFDELEESLPWGLHDGYLQGIAIDWLDARLELTVALLMSVDPNTTQRALITVRGLVYCVIDPPTPDSAPGFVPMPEGLWIDSVSGPAEGDTRARLPLPAAPPGSFVHTIVVRDWNSLIRICGRDVSLSWLEPRPVEEGAR